MCAARCPNRLIKIIDAGADVFVACSSKDKGAFVRKVCSAGCIGCMLCKKACKYEAITIADNLATVDPEKCVKCGECVKVCPSKVIRVADCQALPVPKSS
jgi:heterodisulfide reductase subunit A-like polyferredoxin